MRPDKTAADFDRGSPPPSGGKSGNPLVRDDFVDSIRPLVAPWSEAYFGPRPAGVKGGVN